MSSDCWNAGRQKKETPQPVPTYRYSKLNTAPPNRNHPRRTGLFHQRCYTFFLRCGFPHQRLLNEGCFTKKNSTFFNFVGASGAGLEGVATIVDARSMRSEHRRLRIDHLCSSTLPPPKMPIWRASIKIAPDRGFARTSSGQSLRKSSSRWRSGVSHFKKRWQNLELTGAEHRFGHGLRSPICPLQSSRASSQRWERLPFRTSEP